MFGADARATRACETDRRSQSSMTAAARHAYVDHAVDFGGERVHAARHNAVLQVLDGSVRGALGEAAAARPLAARRTVAGHGDVDDAGGKSESSVEPWAIWAPAHCAVKSLSEEQTPWSARIGISKMPLFYHRRRWSTLILGLTRGEHMPVREYSQLEITARSSAIVNWSSPLPHRNQNQIKVNMRSRRPQ